MKTASRTAARTLDVLARHYGFSDEHLADLANGDYSRATIQARRCGRTAVTAADAEAFAEAFGLPAYVLLMEATEALRWVLDNVAGGGIPATSSRQRASITHRYRTSTQVTGLRLIQGKAETYTGPGVSRTNAPVITEKIRKAG